MENITVSELVNAAGGGLLSGEGSTPVLDISTDSRLVKEGDLYVPILGERVDGHRFISQAAAAGAACSFTSEGAVMVPDARFAQIGVEDTLAALQAVGAFCRMRLSASFVGVTGSVGKTSTRTMISTALSAGLDVCETEGNANSQVGVPITLSRIRPDCEAAVIELGMSFPGEMHRIAQIAGLDAAVITNIGVSHIEQLGSREAILAEKLHVTDGLREGGTLILNGDDPYLCPSCRENQKAAEILKP